ncbi:MAG: type II toxin-antitoxin system HicA family toxin [Spirochaetota bacterium]
MKTYSGKEVVAKLIKAGWTISRQKGSHVMLERTSYIYTISVPQHKELGIGILKSIIKQANITLEEFKKL